MGIFASKKSFPIKVFAFGNKNGILEKIFTENLKDKFDEYKQRKYKKETNFKENETGEYITEKIEWDVILYPDINDDNMEALFTSLQKGLNIPEEYDEKSKNENFIDEDSRMRSRNIIIKFGKKNLNYLINYMDSLSKTHLPQIAIVTSEEFDEINEGLEDNRYLTIIKDDKSDKDLLNDIISYLWSKECYYNERGNVILSQPSINKNKKQINTNNYINIMVTGISRSGKSTLINILSQKLVTLESPFLESVTNKIREYEIITSKNGIFQSGIRLIDTPGLTKIEKSKIDTIEMVKSTIKNKIKECNDAKEDIHLIYFVLKPSSNLENYVDFFKFIIDINKERLKKGKKKIYIIFIINQSTGKTAEESLKEYLRNNNLLDLHHKISKPNENKKLTFKERFAHKMPKKEMNEMKDNIISVNLLKTKANSNVYGIDNLLKLTLDYLKKDNPFDKKIFDEMENMKHALEKIEDNKRQEFELKANKNLNQIAKENSLLSGCTNIIEILSKAKTEAKLSIYYENFIFFFMFIFLNEIGKIERYINLFQKIESCYKIFTDEIEIFPIITQKNKKLIFEGFDIIDHSTTNKDFNLKELEEKKNIFFNSDSEIVFGEMKISINGKIEKKYEKNFIFGESLLNFYAQYLIKYFENYIKKQCCIDYIIKQKNIYSNIFEEIEEMSKNNWEKFHPQII